MQVLYTASATATVGRQGRVRSSDGVLDLGLALPKELGGAGGAATNPEQLFAAGYAACSENALLRVARERKAPIRESSVTARVGIGRGGAANSSWRSSWRCRSPVVSGRRWRRWSASPTKRCVPIPGQRAATSGWT